MICSRCARECINASDIFPDAFLKSIYDIIKNFEKSQIVFKRTKYGSDESILGKVRAEAEESNLRTLIELKHEYSLVEVGVYQWDRDIRSNISELKEKLEEAVMNGIRCNYEERYLVESGSPLLTNLICFSSNVRIRNPLIHKKCLPSEHRNRLILYSFENVYDKLKNHTGKEKTVKCIFPGCPNHFDMDNF